MLTHALQISAQFFVGSTQFLIVCMRRCQVILVTILASCLFGLNLNQNSVLISLGRCYSLLESENGLHELLHGEVVSSF